MGDRAYTLAVLLLLKCIPIQGGWRLNKAHCFRGGIKRTSALFQVAKVFVLYMSDGALDDLSPKHQ